MPSKGATRNLQRASCGTVFNTSEKLVPGLADLVGDDVPDDAVNLSEPRPEPTDDPARVWLTDAEYQRLSTTKKTKLR